MRVTTDGALWRNRGYSAAVGQNQATFSVGGVIGPTLAGFLFQIARPLPFLGDALSYAVSFGSLMAVRASFAPEKTTSRRPLHLEV